MEQTPQDQLSEIEFGSGHCKLTREKLYALVWQTPLLRLAKTFGLSDVGLRKICVKNDIPTPPLGYWAKLEYGKRVTKPALPPLRKGGSDTILLTVRPAPVLPPDVGAAYESALMNESGKPAIVVAPERPAKLHPITVATGKAVRAAKADREGFKIGKGADAVQTAIGAASLDRVLCIVDAFVRAAQERGCGIHEHEDGIRIEVDGVPFAWRVYEIKDRVQHKPTKDELKRQAQEDEWRSKWSNADTRRDTKVYAAWDYFPSGRLAMSLTDTTCPRWSSSLMIGRWHDRKNKRLEEYLGEAMSWLTGAAVIVKHRLAEEAERARQEAIELERRRKERARHERTIKRHEFLLTKADDFARYEQLAAFASHLETHARSFENKPVDRLIEELRLVVEHMSEAFERESLEDEVGRLRLYTEDDLNSQLSLDDN